ncbi:type II toxin-antitoxin system RelE/ParE family toxin [Kovacikia minuta CCNUW1]|uniref:type II toxin-antitoxin system RelE family toxin n=1 Tax=Kovacikia minuta TaxID=2931930 RepID=UPI001CCD0F75|nr:type II toxin-antitoxin system RelE/ParE family toxin [Kovacikia minuta]UBF26471.1 type II toxin-antitoxin system RelE/ParE family toxin [Kovacikia minuta CCNUW1]
MTKEPDFALIFAPEVVSHLQVIDKKYHSLIRETIAKQLAYTPLEVTRNRKPLEQPAPFGATWELRFGTQNRFRVFYEVDTAEKRVLILAISVKDREKLVVGGEEVEL